MFPRVRERHSLESVPGASESPNLLRLLGASCHHAVSYHAHGQPRPPVEEHNGEKQPSSSRLSAWQDLMFPSLTDHDDFWLLHNVVPAGVRGVHDLRSSFHRAPQRASSCQEDPIRVKQRVTSPCLKYSCIAKILKSRIKYFFF